MVQVLLQLSIRRQGQYNTSTSTSIRLYRILLIAITIATVVHSWTQQQQPISSGARTTTTITTITTANKRSNYNNNNNNNQYNILKQQLYNNRCNRNTFSLFELSATVGNKQHYDYDDSCTSTTKTETKELITGAITSRRKLMLQLKTSIGISTGIISFLPQSPFLLVASAIDDNVGVVQQQQQQQIPVDLTVSGDAKRILNEGRAYEMQGNTIAAERLYQKVIQLAPRYIYGYSNLGNTQTGSGNLIAADTSYTTAINLCNINLQQAMIDPTIRKCTDLYILLLNRGCIRLNTIGQEQLALRDLQQANALRGRPDSTILQNLARAEEINGLYDQADRDYTVAISMTANEVNPYWLRAALVKYQLRDSINGYELFRRVENRFPDAPEVRAASAIFLLTVKNDPTAAQQKFLQIPNRQRLLYTNTTYITQTIHWPPAAIQTLSLITTAVGDQK